MIRIKKCTVHGKPPFAFSQALGPWTGVGTARPQQQWADAVSWGRAVPTPVHVKGRGEGKAIVIVPSAPARQFMEGVEFR